MRIVELVLYTILRDATGRPSVAVECREGDSLRALLEKAARETRGLARALEAVSWNVYGLTDSGERVELDDMAPCGSRIHVVPPPSGGSPLVEARLVRGGVVDVSELVSRAASAGGNVGAVAVFVGYVKGFSGGARVERLVYEAAEDVAGRVIEGILREEAEANGLAAAIVYHHVGVRLPGEQTIVAVVAGESRSNVYPGLQRVVDRVKREAPIWKVEYREGGVKAYILGDRVVEIRAEEA